MTVDTQQQRVDEVVFLKRKKKADYYLANKDRIAERTRNRYPTKKAKVSFANRKRRRHIVAIDELRPGEWEAMVEACEDKCIVEGCGTSPVTMDHVNPLSKGGRHHISNLQPICHSCNAKKGTSVVDYRRYGSGGN